MQYGSNPSSMKKKHAMMITLDECLEKVMKLIGLKKVLIFL
jgi:hypothetical protein